MNQAPDSRKKIRTVWTLPQTVVLHWRCWDPGEIVVFNEGSGQTHLLDAFSAEVLRKIESAPIDLEDLKDGLVKHIGQPEEDIYDRLTRTISAFDSLGLAMPVKK